MRLLDQRINPYKILLGIAKFPSIELYHSVFDKILKISIPLSLTYWISL